MDYLTGAVIYISSILGTLVHFRHFLLTFLLLIPVSKCLISELFRNVPWVSFPCYSSVGAASAANFSPQRRRVRKDSKNTKQPCLILGMYLLTSCLLISEWFPYPTAYTR
jgi:hypothetical protein